MKKLFILLAFSLLSNAGFSKAGSEIPTIEKQLTGLNVNWKAREVNEPILQKKLVFENDAQLIQLHLSLVEKNLRQANLKHLSKQQIQNRIKCLDILHDYWTQGIFPKNIYHAERTPYFIDHLGTACAVGQLIISTGNESLAKKIAAENNYGYIKDLKVQYKEINTWAKEYGFTVEELAWIQPTYGSDPYYLPIICDSSCTPPGTQVSSSFIAHDSVKAKYKADAGLIALRWIYENDLAYKDSVNIPQKYIDTVLNTLIAIHNAPWDFTPRDTVVEMLEIHTKRDSLYSVSDFYITTTGKPGWLQNLENGLALSGNSVMDSLITNYGISYVDTYDPYFWMPDSTDYIFHFKTGGSYNIAVLVKDIATINGVKNVSVRNSRSMYTEYFDIDRDIKDFSIHPGYTQVSFYYEWTCQSFPCSYRKYSSEGREWVFKVYDDGIVEFVESTGSPLEILTDPVSIDASLSSEILIYPNPFVDEVKIEGMNSNKFNYSLSNIVGEELLTGESEENRLEGLSTLPAGQYILRITSKDESINKILIKN